jgi:hypothetical protein
VNFLEDVMKDDACWVRDAILWPELFMSIDHDLVQSEGQYPSRKPWRKLPIMTDRIMVLFKAAL